MSGVRGTGLGSEMLQGPYLEPPKLEEENGVGESRGEEE
jgi:hypothetical protein